MLRTDFNWEQIFMHPLGSVEPMLSYSQQQLTDFAENVAFEWQQLGERSTDEGRPATTSIRGLVRAMEGLDPAWAAAMDVRAAPRVTWRWHRNFNMPGYRGEYHQLGGIALFRRLESEELEFRHQYLYRPNAQVEVSNLRDSEVADFELARTNLGYEMRAGHLVFNGFRSGNRSINDLVRPIGRDMRRLLCDGVMAGPYIQRTDNGAIQLPGVGLYEKITVSPPRRRQWLVPSLRPIN